MKPQSLLCPTASSWACSCASWAQQMVTVVCWCRQVAGLALHSGPSLPALSAAAWPRSDVTAVSWEASSLGLPLGL